MSIKTYSYITIMVIVILTVSACKKNSSPPNKTNTPTKTDIYISGVIGDSNNNSTATYWKNGEPTYLGSGYAEAIAISNNDVYVVGAYAAKNGNYVATYWKNGTAVKLADSLSFSEVLSIYIQGNDIYMAGITGTSSNNYTAVYWKNGVAAEPSIMGEYASCLSVNDNNLYIAGATADPNLPFQAPQATYWKNGTPIYLASENVQGAAANSIAIDGTDIYISGTQYIEQITGPYQENYYRTATYWKNGVQTLLDDTLRYSEVDASTIQNHTVLFAGSSSAHTKIQNAFNNVAAYWKNNTKILLADTLVNSSARGIAVNGNDVYIVGGYNTDAVYWKNGVMNKLTKPVVEYGGATGIVILSHN
jgi:hypothetical protein